MAASAPYLLLLILIPLVGMLFALTARDNDKTRGHNVLGVTILAIAANIFIMLRAFLQIKPGYGRLQLSESYRWMENPQINLSFGVDSFALLLIIGVNLAVLIGLWGVRHDAYRQKPRMIFTLLFLSMVNGFLAAADIFSFFIFFEAMLLPLFMLVGMFGEVKKQGSVFRFMLYNLLGALLLLAAIMVLYNHYNGSIRLNEISGIKMGKGSEVIVWSAIFIALMSRIPIWPFHYWIASVNAMVKNPLVFIIANIIPLTGMYGFMRFWPKTVPDTVSYFIVVLEIISVISMLFLALIGLINKDFQYKIFAFMTVYYIFYLLGVFLPTDQILLNVGFSVFSFLIIFAAIEVLTAYTAEQEESNGLASGGILCFMPRLSAVLTFMVLAAVGLPISSMFVNNFVIMSGLLNYNLNMALIALSAMVLAAVAILQELYRRKDEQNITGDKGVALDISKRDLILMSGVAAVLVLSFFNPLWFMNI